MTPVVSISVDGSDITDILSDRLLMLRITDEAGEESDGLDMHLDDRDQRLAWPTRGAQLTISIGYQNRPLSQPRSYTVDEISLDGPPAIMKIRGTAANMTSSLKAHVTRHWEDHTLGDIVKTIASKHALEPKVSVSLAQFFFADLDQTDESDLHFLTRIAHDYDAIAKPVNGFLVVAPKGEAKSVSGKFLPAIDLSLSDLIDYQFTQAERGRYQSVQAYWHENDTAQRQRVTVGEGDPVYTLRHPFASAEEAKHAANKKYTHLVRGTATLTVALPGNNQMQAEGRVRLNDARTPLQGEWVVHRVEHVIDNQGFRSRVELETPNT